MRRPWNWERSGCHRRNREFPKDVIDLLDGQSHLPAQVIGQSFGENPEAVTT